MNAFVEALEDRALCAAQPIPLFIATGKNLYKGIAGQVTAPITAKYANYNSVTAGYYNVPMTFQLSDFSGNVISRRTVPVRDGIAVFPGVRLTQAAYYQLWAYPRGAKAPMDSGPFLSTSLEIIATAPASMRVTTSASDADGADIVMELDDRFGNPTGNTMPTLTIRQPKGASASAFFQTHTDQGAAQPYIITRRNRPAEAFFYHSRTFFVLQETGSAAGVPVQLVCSDHRVKPITVTALPILGSYA
jgi:hypothetical protein